MKDILPDEEEPVINDGKLNLKSIDGKIFLLRSEQVMLDRDLAELYRVETRTLKQAVRRNMVRFPPDFLYQLTEEEVDLLVSQSVIPSKKQLGGATPFAFTEQGVSMLSSVLTSKTAIEINIQIMRAFVKVRKLIHPIEYVNQRMDRLEMRQIEYKFELDKKFNQFFQAIESKKIRPKEGIFFNGQVFDAYQFVSDLFRSADRSILIIDNYVDDTVLAQLSKRKNGVKVKIATKRITQALRLDVAKYNSQYPAIELIEFRKSHDRFVIIDNKDVYHIGASLKDLGNKWFAFSKIEMDPMILISRIEKIA